jgi:hypothetical protein
MNIPSNTGMLHLEGFFSFARKAVHNAYDRCGKIRDKLTASMAMGMGNSDFEGERVHMSGRHALILPLALGLNGKKHAVISSWSDVKMCPVTHQGYMVKHARSSSNNWKLRYHRLIEDELYYFRREEAIGTANTSPTLLTFPSPTVLVKLLNAWRDSKILIVFFFFAFHFIVFIVFLSSFHQHHWGT